MAKIVRKNILQLKMVNIIKLVNTDYFIWKKSIL